MNTAEHGYPIAEDRQERSEGRTEQNPAEMTAAAKRQSDIREHVADAISGNDDSERNIPPEEVAMIRLAADPAILDNFIRRQNFYWDHQAWLGLLDELERAGYAPFNPDRVGLLLEARREELRRQ